MAKMSLRLSYEKAVSVFCSTDIKHLYMFFGETELLLLLAFVCKCAFVRVLCVTSACKFLHSAGFVFSQRLSMSKGWSKLMTLTQVQSTH